ncbi:hypothetical protein [Pseudarthrobacter raffinosi]|uniref:hypothetical protein n=1 Tax=Pseudarthrobacter raffinosi TaxID=2953651 RepID=UPI00208F13AD|nr:MULTISPECIES: hypothetical protein [unclassified Pseudarthrobacter]MCO4251184.1 hypothetical protein [Pseudarthrobacter sp. MDT3-9]MCO4265072.1 hypothetical protein [Pseudarthrobacter sp. MDT3-26]
MGIALNHSLGPDGNMPPTGGFPAGGTILMRDFRRVYLGDSLLACLIEVLTFARKDNLLAEDLDKIIEELEDAERYPTQKPGTIDKAWMEPRVVAMAGTAISPQLKQSPNVACPVADVPSAIEAYWAMN